MATAAQLKELRRKHHLGEFRRSSQSSGSARQRTKIKHRGGIHMAKRTRARSRSRSFGGSGMMHAPIKVGGMVDEAAKGLGAAVAVAKFAPNINIPYKYPIAGYLFGGVPGAIAAWFVMGGSATVSGGSSLGGVELN